MLIYKRCNVGIGIHTLLASDKAELSQKVLRSYKSHCNPCHVLGDVESRLHPDKLSKLKEIHERHVLEYSLATKELKCKQAYKQVHTRIEGKFLAEAIEFLEEWRRTHKPHRPSLSQNFLS